MKCKSCSKRIFIKPSRPLCGHIFHNKCIGKRQRCVVCDEYILRGLPLLILKSNDPAFISESIDKISKSDIRQLLIHAANSNNETLIDILVEKLKNPKSVAMSLLSQGNATGFKNLMPHYGKIKNKLKYDLLSKAIDSQMMYLVDAVVSVVGDDVEEHFFNDFDKPPPLAIQYK